MIESFHFFEQISSRVLRLLRKKNSNKLSDKVQDYSMKSGIVPWTFPQLFFSIPWENAPTRPWKTYSWTPRVKENFFSKANWIGNRVDDGNEFIGDYQWLRRREFLSLRRSRDKKKRSNYCEKKIFAEWSWLEEKLENAEMPQRIVQTSN